MELLFTVLLEFLFVVFDFKKSFGVSENMKMYFEYCNVIRKTNDFYNSLWPWKTVDKQSHNEPF